MNKNQFIADILAEDYGVPLAMELSKSSPLIKYLVIKTQSVDSSSKARGSFANLYALYVLVEDYISGDFIKSQNYCNYEGMVYSKALKRQRELPFGEKLQNHALNNRCNDEFKKFFNNDTEEIPIIRNLETKKYWINEKLLLINTPSGQINIAPVIIKIIDTYVSLKIEGFQFFFNECENIKATYQTNPNKAQEFILNSLRPESDARIFEIVSFVILKYYYIDYSVCFGDSPSNLYTYPLTLYKTGRTNANDGGIDYIMKPTGRIFQVTEVLDFKKYFLDLKKINHYPITFVVKQNCTPQEAFETIKNAATIEFINDPQLLRSYLDCFEEIITIPNLIYCFDEVLKRGHLSDLLDELILQCKVEYNLTDED